MKPSMRDVGFVFSLNLIPYNPRFAGIMTWRNQASLPRTAELRVFVLHWPYLPQLKCRPALVMWRW
jgi:hypothetical protein